MVFDGFGSNEMIDSLAPERWANWCKTAQVFFSAQWLISWRHFQTTSLWVSTLGVWKYGVLSLKRPRLQNRAKVSAKPDAKLKSTESETSLDVVGRIATPNLDSFFFDLHRGTAVKLRKGIPSHQFHSGILLRVYFWITCFLLGQLNRMSGFFGVFIVEIYRWGSLLFRHFLCLLSRCRHSTHALSFLMLDISKSKSLRKPVNFGLLKHIFDQQKQQ